MGDIERIAHLARQHAAAGEWDALAVELLKLAVANRGIWNGPWAQVLDELRALPLESRTALADALVVQHHSAAAGPVARGNSLTMIGVVARGLPGDRLSVERLKKLDELGRRQSFWYLERHEVLAEAELAAGRALAPAVVAVFRRAALDAYRDAALPVLAGKLTEPVLNVGEEWAEQALRDAEDVPEWQALLRHVTTATAAKPTRKWEQQASALIEPLGADRVRATVVPWLALVGRRTFELERGQYEPDVNNAYDPYNANALRGLTWVLALLPSHQDTARALGGLVETSLKKAAGLGPRNPKVANAGVNALSRIDGEPALAELARLARRVTYKGTLKLVDAALEARARVLGLSREEIEELAVPAYGLTEVGRAERQLGEVTAVLEVRGAKVVLGWRTSAGKEVKSVPAAVRRDHAEELKELKAAAKDIDKMRSAQSDRLDRQFVANRSWSYAGWRERCLDHPLVGTLARRLLWTVDGTTVGFADGELRTLTDDPVREGAEVRLWHPVGHQPAEMCIRDRCIC